MVRPGIPQWEAQPGSYLGEEGSLDVLESLLS